MVISIHSTPANFKQRGVTANQYLLHAHHTYLVVARLQYTDQGGDVTTWKQQIRIICPEQCDMETADWDITTPQSNGLWLVTMVISETDGTILMRGKPFYLAAKVRDQQTTFHPFPPGFEFKRREKSQLHMNGECQAYDGHECRLPRKAFCSPR